MKRKFEPIQLGPLRFPARVFMPKREERPSAFPSHVILKEILRVLRCLDGRNRSSSE